MANSVSNVTSGKPNINGAIYKAPLGTTLPASALEELSADFKSLGYISSDGVTEGAELESETIKAWGGDVVLIPFTGKTDTYAFKLIEYLNTEAMKVRYGDDNVTGDLSTGVTIKSSADEPEGHVYVIDQILKGNYLSRTVLFDATVTTLEEISYIDNDAAGYGVTLTLNPDSEGYTFARYIAKSTSTNTASTASVETVSEEASTEELS